MIINIIMIVLWLFFVLILVITSDQNRIVPKSIYTRTRTRTLTRARNRTSITQSCARSRQSIW